MQVVLTMVVRKQRQTCFIRHEFSFPIIIPRRNTPQRRIHVKHWIRGKEILKEIWWDVKIIWKTKKNIFITIQTIFNTKPSSYPSWSSDILYQLPPSTTIHSILCVQFTCLTVRFDNLSSGPLWSSSLSGALYFIFHTTPLLHPFNGLFSRTTRVSQYQKGTTSLDLNDARDDGALGCSGISWTICKQSAPRSRQITTPTPHHSIFTGRMLFLMPNQQCQSTKGNSYFIH